MPAWWSCSRQLDGEGKWVDPRLVVQVLALGPLYLDWRPLPIRTESRVHCRLNLVAHAHRVPESGGT